MRPSTDNTNPTITSAFIGFGMALALTVIPFALTATKALSMTDTLIIIAVLAVIQIAVHLRYFLRIGLHPSSSENLLAFTFAAILIVIMIGGTLWIMFDLHCRMMM
jgi:cytochrome o ubiquinol oxidase operon protein cyoD